MELLELIIECHRDNERQGPGSEDATFPIRMKKLKYWTSAVELEVRQ
ncbi:hypothetical protein [Facklamia languida]